MKNIIYDAMTKETTIVETPDVAVQGEQVQPPAIEERVLLLQDAVDFILMNF